jgi:GxxExxY protein
LRKKGFKVEEEKALPLVYEEVKLDCGYRIDMLVENEVIIELKTVEAINDVHIAQILTYL